MGMSIDDARREMISGKPYTDKFAMALVVAIDTMRKYQQIQKIYSDVLENNDGTHFLEDVSEVLEDGNN